MCLGVYRAGVICLPCKIRDVGFIGALNCCFLNCIEGRFYSFETRFGHLRAKALEFQDK